MDHDEASDGQNQAASPGRRLITDTGLLSVPAVVVHGGAGTFARVGTGAGRARLIGGIHASLEAAWAVLGPGGRSLDAVVAAVVSMEDSGLFNAGKGAAATAAGGIETDAAVMDGSSGAAGAVCAATWPANPIMAAALVAGLSRTQGGPILLAGPGADALAAEAGLARMQPAPGTGGGPLAGGDAGTVGAVAVDAAGKLAAATSTGGREGQRPGRVGDSPIFGAGTWADDTTAAVSGTGAGEAFILAGFAHLVDWFVRQGADLAAAVSSALAGVAQRGGYGGAIALSPDGRFAVVFDARAMARGWRDADGATGKALEPNGG